MEQGLMLALLLVTANLDTLLLAAVWHSDGRRITWQEAGILTLTTSLMTGLALLLGQCGSGLWSVTAAKRISALLLVPVWAVLGNAVVTLAALALGGCLAGRWLGKVLGDWQVPISGALLIVMGALAGI